MGVLGAPCRRGAIMRPLKLKKAAMPKNMKKIIENDTGAFPKTLAGYYAKNFWDMRGKKFILWSVIFVIAYAGGNVFTPIFMKWFINVLENIGSGDFVSIVAPFAIVSFFIYVSVNILATIQTFIFKDLIPLSIRKISTDLYDYVYSQSSQYYANTIPGKISNQINYIAHGFYQSYRSLFGEMLYKLIAVIISFGLVLALDWRVAFILITGTVFRIIWALYRRKPIATSSKNKSDSSSMLNGELLDSLSNFMVVKLFAGKDAEKKKINPEREKLQNYDRESRRQNALFWIIPAFIEDAFVVVVMLVSAMIFAGGGLSVAEAVFIITAYTTISSMVWNFVYQLPEFLDTYSQASESYGRLIKPIAVMDDENAPDLKVSKGTIQIKNMSFKYHKKTVIENLNLTIPSGQKIGIVGQSGAGKTTLSNLLMRLYDPFKGGIYIDGQDIRHVTQDSLRQSIAFIPQDPTMFNRTLKENIGYGKIDATDKEIKAAAKFAAADEFINDAPNKYETKVGDRGIKLSGGQRQRISIARAFLKDAPILVLDEATSALDSETEAVIQGSLAKLSAGRTTIAIAHRLSTLRHMDRIIVMDQGRVVEDGSHNELLKKKNGIYAKLWRMQSGGFLPGE